MELLSRNECWVINGPACVCDFQRQCAGEAILSQDMKHFVVFIFIHELINKNNPEFRSVIMMEISDCETKNFIAGESVARQTNNQKVVGSRPTNVVCITVLTGNRLGELSAVAGRHSFFRDCQR